MREIEAGTERLKQSASVSVGQMAAVVLRTGGQSSAPKLVGYQPIVESVIPAVGGASATEVHVRVDGLGLLADASSVQVSIGDVPCTGVGLISARILVCTAAAFDELRMTRASMAVSVTVNGRTGVGADKFRYEVPCPAGRFAQADECRQCAPGRFQLNTGELSCLECTAFCPDPTTDPQCSDDSCAFGAGYVTTTPH